MSCKQPRKSVRICWTGCWGCCADAVLGRDRHREMGVGREGKPPWQHQHAPRKPRAVMPGQRFVFQGMWHMVGLLLVLPGRVQRTPCRAVGDLSCLECCHSACVFWFQSLGHLLTSLPLPLATVTLARIPVHQLLKGSVWVRGMSSGSRLSGSPASQGAQEALLGSQKCHRAVFHMGTSGKPSCVPGLCQCQLPWRWHSGAPSIPTAGTGGSMGSASDGREWEENGEAIES